MLRTYKAVLHGDVVEWSDEVPDLTATGHAIPVYVTILDEAMYPALPSAGGQQMAAALERLATAHAVGSIPDPVSWQREMRQERDLPGRDA